MKPLFVVFEGLDGSGSTTQARKLAHALPLRTGKPAVLTSEPSDGPIGQMIRSAMSHRLRFSETPQHFDRQLAFLFAADRYDHLYNDANGIVSTVSNGSFVISTRYFFSSYAYHCHSDEDRNLVSDLNRRFPNPDLTIFLDVSVETSMQRISYRSHLDAYENEKKLEAVYENYRQVFRSYTNPLLIIDGSKTEDEIHIDVINRVLEVANNGK